MKLEKTVFKIWRRIALSAVLSAFVALFAANKSAAQNSEQPVLAANQPAVQLTSEQFVGQDGLTAERLVELGSSRRSDLLAARQRLAVAQGRLRQAGLRPNPTLDAEYGSPRVLGGEPESDFSIGVTQVFETGGKRSRRIRVAELEINQIRHEITAVERQLAAEIRAAYSNAVASARQLDVIERLLQSDAELVRITDARLREGDVAPLDLNLVRVENDRLRVQAIAAKSDLETNLIALRTLVGADLAEAVKLAPQAERPPRLDLSLAQLTNIALQTRADLQAARLGEELGTARINLARSNRTPNVAASVRYGRSKEITDLPERLGGGDAIDQDNELTFGVSVEIPIFNRNSGEIRAATEERVQAVRQREFLEATIRRDVAVSFRRYRAAAETLVLYSTQIVPRSEENLRSVRAAYGYGEFSVFEVVNEQRRLTESVTGYNQSLRDYYNALTELETALGAALPASGFAPDATSVLPDKSIAPDQASRETLLKSLFEKSGDDALRSTKIQSKKDDEDKK